MWGKRQRPAFIQLTAPLSSQGVTNEPRRICDHTEPGPAVSLPQCVDSCRSAKISVEIIVVDDASTDGTADWLKDQKDVVTISGEGWGKPWAVAKALSVAKGTFVRFLDSDDWLSPGANEEQFAIGEQENADLVVSGYQAYRDQTLTQTFPWEATDDFIARQLGEDLTKGSHYSAFMFRRTFIQNIPTEQTFQPLTSRHATIVASFLRSLFATCHLCSCRIGIVSSAPRQRTTAV